MSQFGPFIRHKKLAVNKDGISGVLITLTNRSLVVYEPLTSNSEQSTEIFVQLGPNPGNPKAYIWRFVDSGGFNDEEFFSGSIVAAAGTPIRYFASFKLIGTLHIYEME